MTLNPSQLAAVNSTASRILCCAAAGSGKTRVLIARIQRMIADGIDPASIICLTFTNAASAEIQKRLLATAFEPKAVWPISKMQPDYKLGFCGTTHGFLLRILQQHGNLIGLSRLTVLDEVEAEAMLVEAMSKLAYKGTRKAVDAAVAPGIHHYRGGGTVIGHDAHRVAFEHFHHMLTSGCLTFDMVLDLGLELVAKLAAPEMGRYQHIRQYEHIFLDEAQDSSALDLLIYDALPVKTRFVIGDFRQRIFSFRGSCDGFEQMVAQAPENGWAVMHLEDNYRSCPQVVNAANNLMRHYPAMRSATGTTGELSVTRYDTAAEELAGVVSQVKNLMKSSPPIKGHWEGIKAVDANEIAILCRTNALAAQFRKALADSGVPVRQRRQQDNPLDWRVTRAFIAMLTNPENDRLAYKFLELKFGADKARQMQISANSDFQTLNEKFLHYRPMPLADITTAMVAARIERESVGRVRGLIELLQPGASLLELQGALAEMEAEAQEESDGVTCQTLHKSKGTEYSVIFLPAWEEGVFPSAREAADVESINEARRLAYVGITRAKTLCTISLASSRQVEWKGVEQHEPSRFLKEIGGQP